MFFSSLFKGSKLKQFGSTPNSITLDLRTAPRAYLMRMDSTNAGTFSILKAPGFNSYALELPWNNNKFNFSCVPRGVYQVDWTWSPRFKRNMYLLRGADPRSGIREHPANLAGDRRIINPKTGKPYRSQLAGCIAPGLAVGHLAGQRAILNSALAMVRYENAFNRQSHILVIDGVVG